MFGQIRNGVLNNFSLIQNTIEEFRNNFIKHKNKYLWILSILYKFCMDFYYLIVMVPYYAGDGLVCSPSIVNYIISWIVYIVGYSMILQVSDQIISWFLHLQWILTITPVMVLYGDQSDKSAIYILFILAVVFVQVWISGKREENIPLSFNGGKFNQYLIVMCCIAVPAVWLIMILWNDFGGLRAFDLKYIYQMRSNLYYPPLFGYLVSWIARGVIPWLLIVGLYEKRWFLIFYSLFSQIIYYMLLGYKGYLLIMAVIIAVFVLSKFDILLLGTYLGMLSGLFFGAFSKILEGFGTERTNIVFNSFFGERALFYPAMIKFQFFEVFSQYPKSYFADGMLGKLLSQTYLYKNRMGFIVYAFNNGGSFSSESNTGYLADSYAQMGFAGMLLMGILVILCIRFISKFQKFISPIILCCIVGVVGVELNDGAFLTSFLTGGIWLLLIFLIVHVKEENKNDRL